MLDEKELPASEAESASALRDEEGAIREDFVARIARRSRRRGTAMLRTLAGDLHESDTGDLIEALDPDLRPQTHRAAGRGFRLLGADRSRRHRARGDPRGTARGDRRRGRPRTRFRRRGLHPGRPAEGRAGRDPRAIAGLRARRARAQPPVSRRHRRPAHADRIHRGAAAAHGRRDHRLHARDARSAGALLSRSTRSIRRRNSSARCRSTG